jgi:LCP family protein required for cell wall assembly
MSAETPQYTKYRARPALFRRREEPAPAAPGGPAPPPSPHRRRRVTPGRVLKWLVLAVLGWIALSAVVFLVSAQVHQSDVDAALGGAGYPLTSPNNVLVLGSDTRPEGTDEAGAQTTGTGRSDSILLMRVGGGANSRMSIARDTLVDVPGRGTNKINAAYAFGGASLAVQTIEQYTGIDVHHVIEVNFERFPDLIDAMGGIDYRGACVIAKVNGGDANGGVTIRIRAGETEHLSGREALALARVRKNDCRPSENDLTRARRQQRILAAIRSRALGPAGFLRMPLVAWQVPRTLRTDMSGPTLVGVIGALAVGGTPETNVLGTPSGVVPEPLKAQAVERFLRG